MRMIPRLHEEAVS